MLIIPGLFSAGMKVQFLMKVCKCEHFKRLFTTRGVRVSIVTFQLSQVEN